MTKFRQPLTDAWAVQRAIDVLPLPRLARAAGCSTDAIYKFSNEDEPNKISVERALKIDTLCMETHIFAPFRELFIANAGASDGPPSRTLGEYMLAAGGAVGRASEAVLTSLSAISEGGRKITPHECQTILIEIEGLRRQLDQAERAVIAASAGGK